VTVGLSIRQSDKYIGNDRWAWSVWLDGSSEDLDNVDHVTYILHPTFHDPVRAVKDRSSGFRLETSGWGTFTLLAKISHKDGRETVLNHNLVLSYPDGTPTVA
jgi:transcription initiation factor IIF auxiliary subunit